MQVFAGLLVGAMLPYWFSAMTMKSVGKAALAMVQEVRRQFNTISGGWTRMLVLAAPGSIAGVLPVWQQQICCHIESCICCPSYGLSEATDGVRLPAGVNVAGPRGRRGHDMCYGHARYSSDW